MSTPVTVSMVDSIKLTLNKSNPPQLEIRVNGSAGTPGWIDSSLKNITMLDMVPKGGIMEFVLMAVPPMGNQPEVVTPIPEAVYVLEDIPNWLAGVKVIASANYKEEAYPQ